MYVLTLAVSALISYAVLIVVTLSLGFILLFNYTRLIKKLKDQQNNTAIGMQTRQYRRKRNNRAACLCVSIIFVEFLCSRYFVSKFKIIRTILGF